VYETRPAAGDVAAEQAAAEAIGRRVSRLRGAFLLVAVVTGVGCGVAAFIGASWLQMRVLDGSFFPSVSAVAALGPIALMVWLSLGLARIAVRRRLDGWIDEIAAQHRVAREALDDVVHFHR
jgi:type VI protein secretion system component VasK